MIRWMFGNLCDPRFLFRPDVLARAILRKMRPLPNHVRVKTAWGDEFDLNPHKLIGAQVYMRGVHELTVCEALTRLTDSGEQVADVGANIGIMSSLLSRLVGPTGKVLSCEAHPSVVEELRTHEALWGRHNVRVIHAAVSSHAGTLQIADAPDSHLNEGIARVQKIAPDGVEMSNGYTVPAIKLDELVGNEMLGVLKVDVEGHEEEVFKGAERLLSEGRIRDIVFESPVKYPSAAHQCLLRHGYTIYRIERSALSPLLVRPDLPGTSGVWADFVATKDLDRLHQRFAIWGWKALSL